MRVFDFLIVVLLLVPSFFGFWYLFKMVKTNGKKPNSSTQCVETKPVTSPSQNERNLEKHKQGIEDYDKFLAKVYLCASHNAVGNQTNYVCIDKETEELFSFSAKVIGRSGAFDQYVFSKQPQKITTYAQLLDNLHSKSKKYFSDLSETNWQKYFSFMLLPPTHNSETLRKQLLSCDKGVVRTAIFAVHSLVLKMPEERKAFLSGAYQNILLIEEHLESLNMGGIFVSGNRFANRAIQIIKGNNSDQCFCRVLIDEFGPSANGLAEKGFLLIQEDKKINDYSVQGIIECPYAKKDILSLRSIQVGTFQPVSTVQKYLISICNKQKIKQII